MIIIYHLIGWFVVITVNSLHICICASVYSNFNIIYMYIIIIIINMVNAPRRVQRYGYNRNYNTTADTIASSSLWLK